MKREKAGARERRKEECATFSVDWRSVSCRSVVMFVSLLFDRVLLFDLRLTLFARFCMYVLHTYMNGDSANLAPQGVFLKGSLHAETPINKYHVLVGFTLRVLN